MWEFIKSLFVSSTVIRHKNERRLPRPKQAMPVVITGDFNFLFNDPATPNLRQRMPIPPLPGICPAFQIIGWGGASTEGETPDSRAAQAYATIATTINFFQRHVPSPVHSWAATNVLMVNPHAGNDFNAFYDRRRLMFFHAVDPVRQQMIYTCNSVDVVSHELGHALLDALRPDLWNVQAIEVWSFHEAFGDIIAMLTVMQSDLILQHIVSEVGADFAKSNSVSRLAEDMGLAIYNNISSKGTAPSNSPHYLRDASNQFIYVSPEKLPAQAPDTHLACECHSFGRVFLGAFYDIMVGVYKKELAITNDPIASLRKSRDVASHLILHTIPNAPAVPQFFNSVARTMMLIDKNMGSPYEEILSWAFKRRKIIAPQILALSNKKLDDFNLNQFKVEQVGQHTALHKLNTKTVKLIDYVGVTAQADTPLYNAEVEIPMQSSMLFDHNGNLVEEVKATEKNVVKAVKAAVRYIRTQNIYQEGPMTDDKGKEFSVVDNKLIRNFATCR